MTMLIVVASGCLKACQFALPPAVDKIASLPSPSLVQTVLNLRRFDLEFFDYGGTKVVCIQ